MSHDKPMMAIDLDVHAHLVPIDASRLMEFPNIHWQAEPPRLTLDGHTLGLSSLFFPELLLRWMDEHHVARALISVPPPLYRQHLDHVDAQRWAECLNDGLLAIAKACPDRFSAMLHLPVEHPEVATQLAQKYLGDGVGGVALAAGGNPRILFSDPALVPLWEILDSHKIFVFLHPGACCDDRLSTHYLENLIGNPMETGVAAAHLIMAGVPSRYSNIRFCLAHAGGTFPALVGRMEQGFKTSRPGVNLDVERPLQAAKRFHADCIAHHPSALKLAQDVFGAEKILFGSDWPFPMGLLNGALKSTPDLRPAG